MPESTTEVNRPVGGVVAELVRDDVEREKFLKMAGKRIGAGAAATGVGAYNGAGPSLSSAQYLAAAGSIVQIEARHAASIGLLTGQSLTPNGAFDKGLSKSQVLAKAGPLIKA